MSKLRRVVVTLAVTAVASTTATTSARAVTSGTITGPVLSSEQHQRGAVIDWSRVAAAGSRLAIVEATDGGRYRNPWFGADFGGARAVGLVRGSYAIGRPAAPVVASAVQQADYYLARLGTTASTTRTLPPALDLETTGGLNRAQLVTWAQTFLLRLQSQTGRTPLLHTYSYFWRTALGVPESFARYRVWLTGGDPAAVPALALRTPVQPAWFAGAAGPALTVDVTADDGSWSAMQDGKTPSAWPDAAPGAPLAAHARAYAGAATVTWVPGDTGSSAVTAYHVTAKPGDLSVTVAGGATQATVTGLANGTAYTFTVTPENASGAGVPSSQTSVVTPAATSGAVPRPVASVQRPLYTTNCMPPSNLVRGTVWKRTHPATAVTLQEGQHRDARGRVRMHVLRVNVKSSHVRFAPLMKHVSDRRKLSVLAKRPGLVAATNAGYFDLSSHAPINPVVVNGAPVFGPSVPSTVAGFGPDGLLSAAAVAASGTVTAPGDTLPLAGWNASQPAEGVNAYSARWGIGPVPVPKDAVSRYVVGGVVSSATGRRTAAPASGYLLVARGAVAAGWLRSLHVGDHVGVRTTLASSTRTPYSLAYAVGTHLVAGGVAGRGFSCKRTEKLPARTAIGWTADRRELLLLAVDNQPKSKAKLHGVEPDQLARIMRDLGAAEAYMFDGGGSTEMVVRPRAGARLSIRNHPSDGVERKIPLGFGIFRR